MGCISIAVEFIDGATLREKIHHDHTDLPKLLQYLQHVAEGLANAHAAGIVHRPSNIWLQPVEGGPPRQLRILRATAFTTMTGRTTENGSRLRVGAL